MNYNISEKAILGTATLYNCDCMELLRQTPDNYYSLAIIDPPYGIDVANMKMGAGSGKRQSKLKNRTWTPKEWDKDVPNKEFFDEIFRVSVNQIIWGGNYFELPPCKNYVIWDKEIPNGLSFADCEMAWTSFDKAPKMFRHSVYLGKKERIHPTQKPIELYKWLLDKYAKAGDTILDTHLGSGSIAIAANDLGFRLTACELDKDYFEQAKRRIENHISQQRLF